MARSAVILPLTLSTAKGKRKNPRISLAHAGEAD